MLLHLGHVPSPCSILKTQGFLLNYFGLKIIFILKKMSYIACKQSKQNRQQQSSAWWAFCRMFLHWEQMYLDSMFFISSGGHLRDLSAFGLEDVSSKLIFSTRFFVSFANFAGSTFKPLICSNIQFLDCKIC